MNSFGFSPGAPNWNLTKENLRISFGFRWVFLRETSRTLKNIIRFSPSADRGGLGKL